ncbi:MAG: hypothetical protein ACI828_000207 [Flavobacteriales bacterium]|jgi:hypothetical protein
MGTKKDIGKVFQEKFKDFEQAPDASSWDAIAAGLDGKGKSHYFIPLWLTVGSILLLVVIGLLYWQPWSFQTDEIAPQTVVSTSEVEDGSRLQKNDASNNLQKSNTTITSAPETAVTSNTVNSQKNAITATQSENTQSSKELSTKLDPLNTTTVTGNTKEENRNNTKPNTTTAQDMAIGSAVVAQKTRSQNHSSTAGGSLLPKSILRNADAPGIVKMDATTKERLIAKKRLARAAYGLRISKEKEALEARRLAQITTERTKRDSISKATKAEALALAAEKAKAKADKNKEKKDSQPKSAVEKDLARKETVTYSFAISPYVSVLSYGSLAKGSSIDDRLVDNPRDAIGTQGYGIRLEYSLSERASFRFGIGVSPLKYQTNSFQVLNNGGTINVYQFSGLTPTQLEQGGTPTDPAAVAFFNDYDVITIEQNISYMEIPMDYQYKLINKRIGLSLNPGLSIFILTDNNVFAIANDNTRLRIGRETSLNDLSFAFNLGLGGHYNFAKNWRLDVEPTFRYQLNPYSNSLSNFKPYYFGVQLGATYKF